MKVTMLWFGGPNYAAPAKDDAEHFSSLKAAKDAFWRRADWDPYYPCVESPEAYIYAGEAVTEYPYRVLSIGPRGGVRVERC